MYYKLSKNFCLRGWDKLPYTLVDLNKHKTFFINGSEFDFFEKCDGTVDFSLSFMQSLYSDFIAESLKKNIIVECKKDDILEPYQEYMEFKNRYIRTAHWAITGRCNYRCKHCYMSAPDAKYGELPYSDIANIINQLADCGVYNVALTGGEPLVRKDFFDIVDLLVEKHINIETIYTNGRLVNEKLLKFLDERNLHPEFNMSFDGVDGWHDWLRGVDGATKDVEKAFRLCKNYGFPTGAELCVHNKNKHVFRESINHLANLGCGSVKTNKLDNVGSWKENNLGEAISLEETYDLYLDYIPKYFEDGMPISILLGGIFRFDASSNTWRIPADKGNCDLDKVCVCGHARNTMFISPEGRCLPCPSLAGHDIQYDYPLILEQGLEKCLSDSVYMNLITTKAEVVIEHNDKCKKCKFANHCLGGCRASALAYGNADILGIDECTCMLYNKGYIDKVHKTVEQILGKARN